MSPDLQSGQLPPDPENCAVLIETEIGFRGGAGGDIFSFVAITPEALKSSRSTCWGRGYLILDCFTWTEVTRSLEKLLLHCQRATWHEVAAELNKELHWEFDNYRK